MTRPSRATLQLTQRALGDLQAIYDYSVERWGKATAERYLDDLQSGLVRLAAHPELLRGEEQLHPALSFYRVHKHLFACDRQSRSIVVLAVLHASVDIPHRLAELQPTLAAEVELLHSRLRAKRAR